ncbi:hypothetical protein B0H14DRAFT_3471187 [Mycena olivaceomarginata]|nr:hypothetical protein B0H14DRAFT_3471187 [Mycena olivaceomarginata]
MSPGTWVQLSSEINVPFSHFVDEYAHDTRDGEDLQGVTAAEESQNILGTANTEHVDETTDTFLDPDSSNSNLAEKLPVSGVFKFVLNVQLSLFLFRALSWLYGQVYI